MSEFRVTMIGDPHIEAAGGYDGSDLAVPEADLVVVLGDWVQAGDDAEYEAAIDWIRSLDQPYILIRGNHDNGRWHHAARQVCPPAVTAQLAAHSPVENMQMVEWKPMIWEPVDHVVVNLPKQTEWRSVPAEVQNHIIKLRDTTPAYYTFEAGDMLFVCLDASDWYLGDEQLVWLKATVEATTKPVVILTHHHFLPVGNQVDGAQVHERDFLREFVLRHPKVTACLHGHAHKDCWWQYGDMDILAVRNRACRSVTFEAGRVTASSLDGGTDSPQTFRPQFLWAQCMHPGQVSYMTDREFDASPASRGIPCLGWLPPEEGTVELMWSMRLPDRVSPDPHELRFQIRNEGPCHLRVTSPGLDDTRRETVAPSPDGTEVSLAVGRLAAGLIEAKLSCSQGWGYAALAAELRPIS